MPELRIPTPEEEEHAISIALLASTPREYERAHRAMRRAFPELAASYPCACQECREMEGRIRLPRRSTGRTSKKRKGRKS